MIKLGKLKIHGVGKFEFKDIDELEEVVKDLKQKLR